jgi:hypothetical protein
MNTSQRTMPRLRPGEPQTLHTICPFAADRFAPLVQDLPQETRTIQAVVRTIVAGTWSSEVKLELGLQERPSGTITRLPFKMLEAARSMAVAHRLEVSLPELAPGEYVLLVRARDTVTGTSDTASAAFTVK